MYLIYERMVLPHGSDLEIKIANKSMLLLALDGVVDVSGQQESRLQLDGQITTVVFGG